jgi:hypothetical protein
VLTRAPYTHQLDCPLVSHHIHTCLTAGFGDRRKNDEQKIGAVPLHALEQPHHSLVVDAADSAAVRESVVGTDVSET